MKLKKDWPTRLWSGKWWLLRGAIACLLLVPLFLIEVVILKAADATDWLKWKWQSAHWLWWLNEKFTEWVAKPLPPPPKESE